MLRLAHLVTHPIQYFVPIYRELAARDDIALTVLFGSKFGTQASFDAGFGREVQFDVPLLDGYQHQFLDNRGSGIPDADRTSFSCPKMEELLTADSFDALWVHGWNYVVHRQAFRAADRAGIPYFVRGETNLIGAARFSPTWLLRRWRYGRTLSSATACLYIGQANRAFYKSLGIGDERLRPAHYSVDTKFFQRQSLLSEDRTHFRQTLSVADSTLVVAVLAKLIPRKRVADVVQATAKAGSNIRLWVLGDGTERQSLEALGSQLLGDRVTWFGFVNQSQIPEILSSADVFVLASDDEPWGLVVNEAMACGLPVVVTDRVGCASDLARAETGRIYKTGSVAQLAQILKQFAQQVSMTRTMGRAAQDLVSSQYSSQATASQIANAVIEFTGKQSPRCVASSRHRS